MKWLLFTAALFSATSFAAPECLIDAEEKADSTSLIAVITGSVKGFEPGPVYVTVTNGPNKYTTIINREGKWALMYPSLTTDSQVLCWQGWVKGEKSVEIAGKR